MADTTASQRQDHGITLRILTGLPDQLDGAIMGGSSDGDPRCQTIDSRAILERPKDSLANDYDHSRNCTGPSAAPSADPSRSRYVICKVRGDTIALRRGR